MPMIACLAGPLSEARRMAGRQRLPTEWRRTEGRSDDSCVKKRMLRGLRWKESGPDGGRIWAAGWPVESPDEVGSGDKKGTRPEWARAWVGKPS